MNRDKSYLEICNTIAKQSNCLSRQIGAILVRDDDLIAYGWNHTPKGIPSCSKRYFLDDILIDEIDKKGISFDENKCPRQVLGYKSGEGLGRCPAEHAERDCIIYCAINGIVTDGATMYMNCGIPCGPCMVEILDAGIVELVCIRIGFYDSLSKYLVSQSGIKVRTYDV